MYSQKRFQLYNIPLIIIILLFLLFCHGVTCIFNLSRLTLTLGTGSRRWIPSFLYITPFSRYWTVWLRFYCGVSTTLNRFVFFCFIYIKIIYRPILKYYKHFYMKLERNWIEIHSLTYNGPYPTLSMSCMSLCDTVLPLVWINLLSLLSDGELFDTLCLLCCSSCFSTLSKDFLWVLLVVALCVCGVTWLLLCIPPFCTFVSTELLLPPERIDINVRMRLT